ncbi:MAG: YbaB/EbfC family nucleoid-associated protein [Candidatus Marinimicrobia bacterium]|nr:YbaB/EbfC family nucleoid-associated protein [Candidatus Neomarinimicrobiota bacterium]|tara:strand:- start:56 stop:367 length:312 start_codon:yes stop_codon:yes gene_type:complete
MFKGMSNIYKQAQKMQKDMKKVQDELEDLNVEGQAGGGIIKVVINGKKEPKSVTIDSSVLDEDKEMIEDLVLAAMKNAFDNADKESSEKMKSIAGGMPNIPGF